MGETRRGTDPYKFPVSFFTVFYYLIMTVFTILTLKHVAQLRTQNWLLCKENAVLKKSIKNNLVQADFVKQVTNEEDMPEKE